MYLIIARHGETIANNDDILQGQLDGELSERGLLQAQSLALVLKDEKIDVIYSSDLKRGSETARIIARYHDMPVHHDKLARERNFGVFAGTNRSVFYERERSMADPFSHRPEGGESFEDLFSRARIFLRKLSEKHADERVLLVSHGDYSRMCLGVLTGRSVSDASRIHQRNSCINRVDVEEGPRGRILLQDSIDHLPVELRSNNKSAL